MDLAYLTVQRLADVLKLQRNDIRDRVPWITHNKTVKKLRIRITCKLAVVISRILAKSRTIAGLSR